MQDKIIEVWSLTRMKRTIIRKKYFSLVNTKELPGTHVTLILGKLHHMQNLKNLKFIICSSFG